MKKIYSLNLAAFIMLHTNFEPEVEVDWDEEKGCLVALVFPECEAVSAAIAAYRNDNDLHAYLQKYKDLRQIIAEARAEYEG